MILDYTLCIFPFKYGIGGAAVATGLANVASAVLLLYKVYQKNFKAFLNKGLAGGSSSSLRARWKRFSCMLKLANKSEFVNLIRFAGAIFGVIVGKLFCYSALTLAVTRFGVSSLAAHTVLLRIFFFFATFGDSLSQSVQNFLPAVFTTNSNPTSRAYRRFEKFHVLAGGIVGAVFSTLALAITRSYSGARLFSTNGSIIRLLQLSSKFLGFSLVIHPFVMMSEGVIIAKRDTKYLLMTYVVTFSALMAILKSASNIQGVWRGFFFFQALRLLQFGGRFLGKRRQKVVFESAS